MKTRTVIDEQMCRQVQLLLKGGARIEEAAQITGTSVGTIGRIKKAGFNIDKFNENKERRRKEEQQARNDSELPGQMEIQLPAEEQKEEMSEQTKMMRFQAGQVEKLCMKIDRIYDMMGQILRAMSGV